MVSKKIVMKVVFWFLLFFIFFPISMYAQKEKEIEGVVLKKGTKKYKRKEENPAYKVMAEVWKRKKNNALDKFETYTVQEYEKLQFDLANIDSAFMKNKFFKKMDFVFDYADSAANGKLALPMFLNEAIYKNFGQNQPTKRHKRLLIAQKTSGFQDNEIVTMAVKNLYREINLYDNVINYFDIGFQSPVGNAAFSTYDFTLADTVQYKGQKAYLVRYEPKQKEALAFMGNLYISANEYAVLKATLRSTKKMNVNFINSVFTSIEYDNPDEETFLPKRISTTVEISPFTKNRKNKSIIATRSVFYDEYTFNPTLSDADFIVREEELDAEYYAKNDEYWQKARPDSLNKQEKGIYEMLGKLEQTPRFKNIVRTTETIATGFYNIGNAIDIGNLYATYGYNEIEGDRIRFGARTFFTQNDVWRVQGYGAYGFRDKRFKYALEGKYMFNKVNRFTLGIGTRSDVRQLGARLTSDEGIMSRTFGSAAIFGRGENITLSWVKQYNFFASIDPIKNFTVRLDASHQHIRSADPSRFDIRFYDAHNRISQELTDVHATLSLIARPGAKFSKTGVDRRENKTLAPTIVLKYTRGFDGLLGGEVAYNKIQFLFSKPMLIGTLGKSFVGIEAGTILEPVPLPLQNVIPGNQSYAIVRNTFAQLNYYEFVANHYATGHWEHHFNGKIFSHIPLLKKLGLREVVFLRGAYGTLSKAAQKVNVSNHTFRAPDRNIYYEYGFGIENIGFGNLRIFRVDFNWRGNYLDHAKASPFGIKAGIQIIY